MRVEIRGRNIEITDELRRQVAHGMKPVRAQVPPQSRCEVVVMEEANPAIGDRFVAEGRLHLKGTTLNAREASPDLSRSVHDLIEDLRRQVKKNREKRRARARARRMAERVRNGGRVA